jgi:hypothetical protein
MSDMTVSDAGGETRLAMFRVWMAISGVWVVFWLLIAGIVLAADAPIGPLADRLDLIAIITLLPPLVFLALGMLVRCLFEAIAARGPRRLPPP